ncbi:ABC transporter permease [Paenibacillus cremeus]|uniref:ABC transporter permease n=1 Tax=Paenibacillus cremeus TaxID=2163881 RepID=A0A559K4D9_9BACL|nr:ABC transporter permease [Paenibacillus cremeus]TVY07008.1 ABC transporter permease [Paenibacillus cremeus]
MFNLLLNENMKIYRRTRTWMIIVGLVLTVIGFLIAQQYSVKPFQTANADWKVNMQKQVQNDQQLLANMDRGADWKAHVTSRILVNQYHIDHNIPPTEDTLWGNILQAADLMVVVTVLTVIISGESVAGEYTDGTIKLLLIRPVSRTKILFSKYIASIMFSVLLFSVLFVSAFIVSGVIHGFHDLGVSYVFASNDGIVHETNIVQHAISTYLYQAVQMVMVVTLSFMISVLSRSSAFAIALSIGTMFAGTSIVGFLSQFQWAKFYLFENTDLTQFLTGSPNIPGMTMLFSITMIAVYFILFHVLAWAVFKKRDITA